ncbi:helix-turn-helix transcriptional regulator [Neisseria sicca]|uniref:helix-turn-helix transcriptional regulator n=1 Tax=Neisseria sicca TaxID=490 RepID=UPI001AEF9AAA
MGALGGIVQHHTALYRSVAVHEPTVVIVRRGCKKLRWAGRELRIAAGEAVALAGGQTFDVINIPDSDDLYQAQWIAFEQEAIERFAAQYGTAQAVCDAVKLPHPGRMSAAFDYAAAVLADEEVPHNAAEAALCGVLAWLQHDGIGFAVYEGVNLMRQIRKLITADMAADWSSAMLAQRLNCSEAALRRRLARQDTNFRTLLTDVRMMRALTLLQVTQWPVAQIAGAVGYDCPSRFSARFKERFGCVPSAVRSEAEPAAYRRTGQVSVGVRP